MSVQTHTHTDTHKHTYTSIYVCTRTCTSISSRVLGGLNMSKSAFDLILRYALS